VERTKNGEFDWVDLSATDFEGQSKFYEALFGWTYTDMPFGELPGGGPAIYRMFKSDGHTVAAVSQLPAEQQRPSAWNTYLAVDDVDAAVAKAAELGATVVMPPDEIPGDVGRMAAIQDPTGAYILFYKARHPDESMEYMLPGTLSWNDLGTRDPQRAIDFYANLLGWDVQSMAQGPMPYWVVNVDGQGEGGIMPMPDMVPAEVPAYWLPYFGTTDAKATAAKAVELGGSVLSEPMEVPGMVVFAVLADPAGATFAVMQPIQAA
jgi:hypothetical protein